MPISVSDRGDCRDRDNEQSIAGNKEELVAKRRIQRIGNAKGKALGAPNGARQILDDERKPEGEEQRIERIRPLIERPDQAAFDREPKNSDDEGGDDERAPEPEIAAQSIGHIRPDHQEPAMGHVDYRVEAEDLCQPERHQGVKHAFDQSVECVEKKQRHPMASGIRSLGRYSVAAFAPCRGGDSGKRRKHRPLFKQR
jgi:hypothetical protein